MFHHIILCCVMFKTILFNDMNYAVVCSAPFSYLNFSVTAQSWYITVINILHAIADGRVQGDNMVLDAHMRSDIHTLYYI
jgi:hypothetical protein